MTAFDERTRLVPVLLLSVAAACAPGADYDGLTVGRGAGVSTPPVDPSLSPPRPAYPTSGAFISSLRPRFKWSGASPGAVIELARDPTFTHEVRRFEALDAKELGLSEDLAAGIWFWRLRARTRDALGERSGPVWEILVRGPGKASTGVSDAPAGTIVDADVDGVADLVVGGDVKVGEAFEAHFAFLRGARGGTELEVQAPERIVVADPLAGGSPLKTMNGRAADGTDGGLQRTAVNDLDGDGWPDLVMTGLVGRVPPQLFAVPIVRWGRPADGGPRMVALPAANVSGLVPAVSTAGDVDGDGYGDVLIGYPGQAAILFGGERLAASSQPAVKAVDETAAPDRFRVVTGGFDTNGDGRSDFAVGIAPAPAPAVTKEPNLLRVLLGEAAPRLDDGRSIPLGDDVNSLVNGDFDGDGRADLAAVVGNGREDRRGRVCFWLGTGDGSFGTEHCRESDGGRAFSALTVADLDEDGRDDLVATLRDDTGDFLVRFVSFLADGTIDVSGVAPTDLAFSERITTIWRGRPARARWAILGSTNMDPNRPDKRVYDGIAVYTGRGDRTQLITAGPAGMRYRGLR